MAAIGNDTIDSYRLLAAEGFVVGGWFDRHLQCSDELAIRLEEPRSGTYAANSRKGRSSSSRQV